MKDKDKEEKDKKEKERIIAFIEKTIFDLAKTNESIDKIKDDLKTFLESIDTLVFNS